MADREWYLIPGDEEEYPNLESAAKAAQRRACDQESPVLVLRCTQAVVCRYQREITVKETQVSSDASKA